jgi:hypothetical protein
MKTPKTIPAPAANEADVAAFEARIAQVGEYKARMERLFALVRGTS